MRKKNYTCIKYFSITNEPPGGTWGYWWSYGQGSGTITPALRKVREYLDVAGIEIPLSAPDWTSLPPLDPRQIDFDEFIGAYDIHSYAGIDANGETIIRDWVQWAHGRDKPFFLSEFGNMNFGWGGDHPGPKSFEAVLSNASDIISCLNLGADGMNRWSFVNRGDLDGQWQLIQTWDREGKKYLEKIEPEHPAYFGFGIMSRFIGKYAAVVQSSVKPLLPQIRTTAVLNKTGKLSVFFLNNSEHSEQVSLEIKGRDTKDKLYLYQMTQKLALAPGFCLEPIESEQDKAGRRLVALPGKSISVLTNYYLTSKDPGVIE
jgi:hypothetical protein